MQAVHFAYTLSLSSYHNQGFNEAPVSPRLNEVPRTASKW